MSHMWQQARLLPEKEQDTFKAGLQWAYLHHHIMKLITVGARQYRKKPTFDQAVGYCVTPPVMPPYRQDDFRKLISRFVDRYKEERGLSDDQIRPMECIVCGKVHITSQDCLVRENPEPKTGSEQEGLRPDNGFKLAWAEAHGCFDDV